MSSPERGRYKVEQDLDDINLTYFAPEKGSWAMAREISLNVLALVPDQKLT